MTPPPCPICGAPRRRRGSGGLNRTCGQPSCILARLRRVVAAPVVVTEPYRGLAYYLDTFVPPPEGEFPIQDTPTDPMSFSNC